MEAILILDKHSNEGLVGEVVSPKSMAGLSMWWSVGWSRKCTRVIRCCTKYEDC